MPRLVRTRLRDVQVGTDELTVALMNGRHDRAPGLVLPTSLRTEALLAGARAPRGAAGWRAP